MRLIDKDLILETAKDKEWGLWCEIVNIKFAPEVKAIPIEWIKKWCNIEHKSCEERLMLRYGVITMLEDWEKENESRDTESTK